MVERPPSGGHRPLASWLDHPISGWWCALGWVGSAAVFVSIVQALGGPSVIDALPSAESTLAIAKGQVGCAFPAGANLTGPLYSFVSGGLAAALRVGRGIRLPAASPTANRCPATLHAIDAWLAATKSWTGVFRFGFVGWIFLAAGLVLLLRVSGRGSTRWEPATLLLVACLPPVWLTVESSFHPQDLMSMGLALAAMAFALRTQWLAAGILVALGVMAQEFALLIAIPLLFLAPGTRRWPFLAGMAGTGGIAALTLVMASSPRLVSEALFGSIYKSASDTVVMTLHLSGAPLVFLSKIVPVILAAVISWQVAKRLRPGELQSTAVASLVAVCLSLRLVFEQNMFGYYYMALCIALVSLDVIAGRFRRTLAAWLVMLSLTYLVGPTTTFVQLDRVSWGHAAQQVLTPLVVVLAVAMVGFSVLRRAVTADTFVWLALLCGCILVWPSTHNPLSSSVTQLWWQILLVSSGVVLAARPLLQSLRAGDRTSPARVKVILAPHRNRPSA